MTRRPIRTIALLVVAGILLSIWVLPIFWGLLTSLLARDLPVALG